MMRVANEHDFGVELAQARISYEDFAKRLDAQRLQLAPAVQWAAGSVPELEAHARVYVDAVLGSLNWQVNLAGWETPDLVRESPIRSKKSRTVRFLDYLGCSVDSNTRKLRPLMLVETKRPQADLFKSKQRESKASVLSRALRKGKVLTAGWHEWMDDLRDYVRSVASALGAAPARVVLTNGDWWIVFSDPTSAFIDDGSDPTESTIHIFEDFVEFEKRKREIFNLLEHRRVQGQVRSVELGELAFLVEPVDVSGVMHALKVRYCPVHEVNDSSYPNLSVAPVVVLHLRSGWLIVEGAKHVFRVPISHGPHGSTLEAHLAQVDTAARQLLQDVAKRLGRSFSPNAIEFSMRGASVGPGLVQVLGNQLYLLVTGDRTHFLGIGPEDPACKFHSFRDAHSSGFAARLQILAPAVEPRALFVDGHVSHCAHGNVETSKRTSPAQPGVGLEPGEAFCPLWPIEQRLCCRTCAFESVCTSSRFFHLPCTGA